MKAPEIQPKPSPDPFAWQLTLTPTDHGWQLRLANESPNGSAITAEGQSIAYVLAQLSYWLLESEKEPWNESSVSRMPFDSKVVLGSSEGLRQMAKDAARNMRSGAGYTGTETIEELQSVLIAGLKEDLQNIISKLNELHGFT